MVGTVSAKNLSGIFFTGADRAGVVKQGTKFANGDRQIATEQVFAEEFKISAACRGFHKGCTTGMPRSMPGIFVYLRKFGQSFEHWRQKVFEVGLDSCFDTAGNKVGGIFIQPDEVAGLF